MSETGPRVFIFGSCATRDAFELDGHQLTLAGYIARSSLASAFQAVAAPEAWRRVTDGIASAFERRMVLLDLDKGAWRTIEAARFDCLVIDLIDERFPVALTDETCATVSRGFTRVSSLPLNLASIANRKRWKAWLRGADALVRCAGGRRMVVNRVFWATHFEDGTPIANREEAEMQNAVLERMYEHLVRSHRLPVIEHGSFERAAALAHRWGPAPFHYVDGVYRRTLDVLSRVLRDGVELDRGS